LTKAVFKKFMNQGIESIKGFFPPGVCAWQTNRLGGASAQPFDTFNLATHVGDQPQAVEKNRVRLAQRLGGQATWLNQVHGSQVLNLDQYEIEVAGRVQAPINPAPTADAAFTSQAGPICAVMTADCLPVLIARGDGLQVAAAHAGWRGLSMGVIENTVQAMMNQANAKGLPAATAWYFWLGPAIGQAAFEVGPDVYQAFVGKNLAAAKAFRPHHDQASEKLGKWFASLPMLARLRIESMAAPGGLIGPESQIHVHDSQVCVYSQKEKYFSYRRDQTTGRMASLICRTTI